MSAQHREPPFGSLEWVIRAAGHLKPAGCDSLETSGRHLYTLDLGSGETVPRCKCGKPLPEAE